MAIYCKWIHNHKTDAHNVLMRIYMHNSQIMHCDTFRCHLILLEFIHIDSNNKVIQIWPRKKRVYSFRLEICWQHAKDIGQSASHWDQDATMKSWSVCMQTRSPYEYTFSVQKKIFRRITNRDEKNQPKKKNSQKRHTKCKIAMLIHLLQILPPWQYPCKRRVSEKNYRYWYPGLNKIRIKFREIDIPELFRVAHSA